MMIRLFSVFCILSLLLPSLAFAQETPLHQPEAQEQSGLWVYHYTLDTEPPVVLAYAPLDEAGSAVFSLVPYEGDIATDTLDIADQIVIDLLNFLSSATTTAYRYDENDQRVAQDVKKGTGATTTTTYFSNLYERTGTATTTLYIYAAGQLIATIEGNGSATSTYVTHTDHLNSSNVQSDKFGNLAQLTNYYPYGGMIQNVQPANGYNTKKKFLNQTYDDAIAQSYLNARFLQNNNGRFTSLDPMFTGDPNQQNLVLPQSLNSYSYAEGNPINKSDPTGRTPGDAMATAYFIGAYSVGQAFTLGIGKIFGSQYLVNQATQNLNAALSADNIASSMILANEMAPGSGTVMGVRQIMTGVERKALTAAEQLQVNKAAGNAFEQNVGSKLMQAQPDLKPQVTIKTQDGTKTRIDFIGTNANGNLCLTECKSSATAPLTPNQTKAYPQIQQSGGVVVGQGKPGFPGGTQIAPTTVNVVRP